MASSEGQPRTTLTGKPIVYQHDALTNVMLGDGGGFAAGTAGANLLPHGYTDNSLVRIPIKLSDLEGPFRDPKPVKKGLFSKISGITKDKAGGEIKVVGMSRGDYLKYWAKGEDGHFLPSVEEPPAGRSEWLKQQLLLNEEWKKTGVMSG